MAKVKVENKREGKTKWGEVDKPALGTALSTGYADGSVSAAVIREAYAFVPAEAFGTDANGKKTFDHSKGWGPHHELDGESLVVNRGRVLAAAGALAGARAKPSLSGQDLTRAKAHLRKHYKALKMEAPASIKESLRRIDRGEVLTEAALGEALTKGSLNYTLNRIRDAFREQFRMDYDAPYCSYFWIEEVFSDHLIVSDEELPPDEYWLVAFEPDGAAGSGYADGYVFAARSDWELVELAYQPAGAAAQAAVAADAAEDAAEENLPSSPLPEKEGDPAQALAKEESAAPAPLNGITGGRKGKRLEERISGGVSLLEAQETGGPRRIKAIGITADVVNGNGRRYPAAVLEAACKRLQSHLRESAGQGRLLLLGEAEHPSDKGGRPNLLETVVRWDQVEFDGVHVNLEGILIPTTKGRDISALLESGVVPDISQRAYGTSTMVDEGGRQIEEVATLEITGYDMVVDGSDADAGVVVESVAGTPLAAGGDGDMDPEELAKIIAAHPELFKGVVADEVKRMSDVQRASLEETARKALGIDENGDLGAALAEAAAAQKELAERKQAEAMEAAIAEAVKGLKYGEALNKAFADALRAAKPQDAEAVKRLAEAKRVEYDAIAAAAKLSGMGKSDVVVVGPVIETQTGTPEFAKASWRFTEALLERGTVQPWRADQPRNVNQRLAAKILAKFDEAYKPQLLRESKLIEEAETAAGLNLPYSVSRTILAAVWPTLVATGLFDVNTTDQAPSRVYYEQYAEESGKHVAITDEGVTASNPLGSWVQMAHKRIQPGTVVATDHAGTTTYVEGTDYVINYTDGKFKALAAGSISAAGDVHVDYHYDAIREGEGTAIQQAKMTLSYITLEIAADRLATQINNEAVVFARSQVGWDATNRTLMSLIAEIRRRIDADLMMDALSAALSQANNSGGTWTAASDPLSTFSEYVGVAKVKIAQRFYEPTGILLSTTNADRVANWDGFTAAGKRPDSDLDANGYLGRLKGLPVFHSTEFTDAYGLVFNRELVAHRVYQAMALKGPFPTYSNGALVAADQWYAEEYNGTIVPLVEKGAYVKVA
jgi:hypothetical protein